ncbi:MAG TPA: orotidine-5'-phosphate decarboxylase [Fimbriimonadaceae bacterium]|nr:orotidine-5'-phosphate decarboxylase [Fimbriimonadaceae bacterium]HRJ33048.1 orotidine-5'-phosphate decarboxylase [Fimbriimonadaceae bacterium]
MVRQVICALDTSSLEEALQTVRQLGSHVGAFKIGHALVLPHGLDVIRQLQDAGASRIFLDLKFHDIPNVVALAVREAARAGVWMLTLHIAGGTAMMVAAEEEAKNFGEAAPLLMGVSVLTSLDQHSLQDHLGVQRSVTEQVQTLSTLAISCGLDGVICPPPELRNLRSRLGHEGILVAPGIRLPSQDIGDQKQVGTPNQAIQDGANYVVMGRALSQMPDIERFFADLNEAGTAV